MAEGEDKDSKTEEPTEKKLRDAIDKGNVPFSREVPIFASILGTLVVSGVLSARRRQADLPTLPERSFRTIRRLAPGDRRRCGWRCFRSLFFEAGVVMVPAFSLLMGFGIAASVLQNMPSPVLDRIQPKLERISIDQGLRQDLRRQWHGGICQIECSRSLWSHFSWSIALKGEFFRSLDFMFMDPNPGRSLDMARISGKVIIVVLLCTAVLAALDRVVDPLQLAQLDQKMSKQDIKDELKQSDGDPIVEGAATLAGSRPRPAPDDCRGSPRNHGDRQSNPLCGGTALCTRRRWRAAGDRKGTRPDCTENPRGGRRAWDPGFRGSAARTLHVCASLSR
jgi:flagellar biosynthetic protein FlhB